MRGVEALMGVLIVVWVSPAIGRTCLDDIETSMRKSMADSVRHGLDLIDRDIALSEYVYGPPELQVGAMGMAGLRTGERVFCGADGAAASETVSTFFGAEAHLRAPGGLSVRALTLTNSVDPIEGTREGRHTAFGGFVGYGSSIEVGLMRFVQTNSSSEQADGWLVSGASHGIRSTILLGEDDIDTVRLGLDPVPLGPIHLGGSGRFIIDESMFVAEVLVDRLGLTGRDKELLFADFSLQLESSPRILRALSAEVYFGVLGRPQNMANAGSPLRGMLDFRFIASLYTGSRLPADQPALGGGGAMSVGLVGRHGGFYFDLMARFKDPATIDYAVDPYRSFHAVASINVRIDPWR